MGVAGHVGRACRGEEELSQPEIVGGATQVCGQGATLGKEMGRATEATLQVISGRCFLVLGVIP